MMTWKHSELTMYLRKSIAISPSTTTASLDPRGLLPPSPDYHLNFSLIRNKRRSRVTESQIRHWRSWLHRNWMEQQNHNFQKMTQKMVGRLRMSKLKIGIASGVLIRLVIILSIDIILEILHSFWYHVISVSATNVVVWYCILHTILITYLRWRFQARFNYSIRFLRKDGECIP